MPAKTAKQLAYMRMCAHNPEKARKKCPSKKVAEEFSHMTAKPKKPKRSKVDLLDGPRY